MASIISNAAIASAGKVVTSLIGLIVTIVITRLLGVQLYGSFILLLSYGTLFSTIADFGLYLVLTKELGATVSRDEHPKIASTIGSLRLMLLGSVFITALIIGWLLPSIHPFWIWLVVILIGLCAQSISQMCMGVYQAHRSMWPATVGDIVGRLGQLLFTLILAIWATSHTASSFTLPVAVIAFTASTVLALTIHWSFLPVRPQLKINLSWNSSQAILKQSWPLALLLILNVIYFRIDIVMLSFFRSASEIGYYALAYRIIENALFFPAMFGGLLLPQLSQHLHQKNILAASRLVEQSLRLGLLGGGGIIVFLGLLSAPLIKLFSGAAFIPAAPLLSILGIALAVMTLGNIIGFALVAANKQLQLLRLYAFLVVFNVGMNLIFIPRFGATAAAWITVATECIASSVAFIIMQSIIPIHIPWRSVSLVVLIIAFSTGLLYIIRPIWPITISIPVTVIAYLACAHVAGLLSKKHVTDLLHSTS